MATRFSVSCGCCEMECADWRACFSGVSIVLTFVGITGGDNCADLNTSYAYTFPTLSSPTCSIGVNGEIYDGAYVVPFPCTGKAFAYPQWQFGVHPTSEAAVCQVGYDFGVGDTMNFGFNSTTGDEEGQQAKDAMLAICGGGIAYLPFMIQSAGVCCTGSTGHVLIEKV